MLQPSLSCVAAWSCPVLQRGMSCVAAWSVLCCSVVCPVLQCGLSCVAVWSVLCYSGAMSCVAAWSVLCYSVVCPVLQCGLSCVTVSVLEDNAALSELLATKDLPTKEFIEVPIGGGYSMSQFTHPYSFCFTINRYEHVPVIYIT